MAPSSLDERWKNRLEVGREAAIWLLSRALKDRSGWARDDDLSSVFLRVIEAGGAEREGLLVEGYLDLQQSGSGTFTMALRATD
jgi:hypothetical protein